MKDKRGEGFGRSRRDDSREREVGSRRNDRPGSRDRYGREPRR